MNDINKTLRTLRMEYFAMWGVGGMMALMFETNSLPVGLWDNNGLAMYFAKYFAILSIIVCIPLALKLLHFSYVKKRLTQGVGFEAYRHWCEVRYALLVVPMMLNLVLYYETMDSSLLWIAMMLPVAMLFVWPNQQRMEDEMDKGV